MPETDVKWLAWSNARGSLFVLGMSVCLLCSILGNAFAREAPAQGERQMDHGSRHLQCVQVDSLTRVFPDRFPVDVSPVPSVEITRGGVAVFQFAKRSKDAGTWTAKLPDLRSNDGTALAAKTRLCEILPVHVEANSAGCSKTRIGKKSPENWRPFLIREAPFDVAEAITAENRFALVPSRTTAVLVEITTTRGTTPGDYRGSLVFSRGEEKKTQRVRVIVRNVTLPKIPPFHCTNWLWPAPEKLTNVDPPKWWSERHWQLVRNTGLVLKAFGDDTILTPLVDSPHPLIQIHREATGGYTFDYARFDRWVNLFLSLGYRYIEGHHIAMLAGRYPYGGVSVFDERKERWESLLPKKDARDAWLAFLPTFYRDFHAHLKAKGWIRIYLQHQLDEPHDEALYRRVARITRDCMPGIRTIDAINSRPASYSQLVDIQVFAVAILAKNRVLAEDRRAKGQGVWLYHCCSPYPPMPNRHIDESLTNSRLYPWLTVLFDADGYLHWGANKYRGADPYRTSIGPVPGGSQNPGHLPGDNWLFYPGPNGLRGSMRMVAFRDGMIDAALLEMLRKKDPAQADRIAKSIMRSLTDYARDPKTFHRARKQLLDALE